jgi:hypothetical protein
MKKIWAWLPPGWKTEGGIWGRMNIICPLMTIVLV